MAYSIDYRAAAIEFKQSGHTFVELKEVFKITARTYYQWLELREKTGSLQFRNAKERQRKIDPEKLKQALEEKPDAYLRELAAKFDVSTTAIHKRLKKYKITYKKRRLLTLKSPKKTEPNLSQN
jgi:transposase